MDRLDLLSLPDISLCGTVLQGLLNGKEETVQQL
jgi:hypothetical protein